MSTKKVTPGAPGTSKAAVKKRSDDDQFQTLKGIRYERPKFYGIGADGSYGWHYDIDGYPSDNSETSGF